MTDREKFSRRFGHHNPSEKEITVREDAPEELRRYLPMSFYDLGKKPSDLRWIICKHLKIAPDPSNWSEYPNIECEVNHLIENCEWYLVYDIIEIILETLKQEDSQRFADDINEYFLINGIGWKIENGQIEIRGDEVFETAVKTVESVLETAKLQTAKTEIKEALKDLSRRPIPDITGAIQHSLACLECVAREISGNKKSTLGEIMKKNPGVIPSPLDIAVSKIWGYSSEQGRHLKEGQTPGYLEAELVVEVTAAISTYLGKKISGADKEHDNNDLPF